MSVSTGPGATLLTVMPRGPRSRASPLTRPVSADLLIAYTAAPANGTRIAFVLPTLITRPPSGRWRSAACVAANTARTFTATVRSKSASGKSATWPPRKTPALLTRMSRRPKRAAAASMAPDSASASAESARSARARPPAASMRAASACAALSDDWYVKATAAPSAARRSTIAAPMPRAPPVTNATLLSRVVAMMCSLIGWWVGDVCSIIPTAGSN